MNRIERKFSQLRRINKKAFIAFITAGYPNLKTTELLVKEFYRRQVDIIELGVPFSDPMADGPIIQESSQFALKKGVSLADILNLVKKLRKEVDTPICLMTYYNPIFCFGEKEFVRAAYISGVDGVIIPDLPPEEGQTFIRLMNRLNLDTILFLAPTTTPERIKLISRFSRGFIYYVSLTGVTGPRQNLPGDLGLKLREIKRVVLKPVCVGFGVSSPKQVKQIYQISDGVIVGSAIIKKIKENINSKKLVESVGRFVANLKNV
jgi:tryptophan synthase alpha chain